jgi:hypothetical protein
MTKKEIAETVLMLFYEGNETEDTDLMPSDIEYLVEGAVENAILQYRNSEQSQDKIDSLFQDLYKTVSATTVKVDGHNVATLKQKPIRGVGMSELSVERAGCHECPPVYIVRSKSATRGLPSIRDYAWVEGDKLHFFPSVPTKETYNLEVSGVFTGEDEEGNINVPEAIKPFVVNYLLSLLRHKPKEELNDGSAIR